MIKTTVHDDLGICVVTPAVERLTAANATQFKEEAPEDPTRARMETKTEENRPRCAQGRRRAPSSQKCRNKLQTRSYRVVLLA